MARHGWTYRLLSIIIMGLVPHGWSHAAEKLTETTVDLTSPSMTAVRLDVYDLSPNWCRSTHIRIEIVGVQGSPRWIDYSETPDFANAVRIDYISRYAFITLLDSPDGPRTFYVRLANDAGISAATSVTLQLDRTPPSAPQPVARPTMGSISTIGFDLTGASDGIGAGIANYQYERCDDPASTSSAVTSGNASAPVVVLRSTPGARTYLRAQAVDRLGQASEWSSWVQSEPASEQQRPWLRGLIIKAANTLDEVRTSTQTLMIQFAGPGPGIEQFELSEDPSFTTYTTVADIDLGWKNLKSYSIPIGNTCCRCANALALAPDRRSFVVGTSEGTVKHYDLRSGALLHELPGHTCEVKQVDINGSCTLVASGGVDKKLRVSNLADGTERYTHGPLEGNVTDLSFNVDGSLLVHGAGPVVRLLDALSGNELGRQTLSNDVLSTRFIDDERILLVANLGDTRIWNWKTDTIQTSFSLGQTTTRGETSWGQPYFLTFAGYRLGLHDAATGGLIEDKDSGFYCDIQHMACLRGATRVIARRGNTNTYAWDFAQGRAVPVPPSNGDGLGFDMTPDESEMIYNQSNAVYHAIQSISYTLQDRTNGPHTLYARVRNAQGVSDVTSGTIILDTEGPYYPQQLSIETRGPGGTNPVHISWSPASDEYSGVQSYDVQIRTADRVEVLSNLAWKQQGYTLHVSPGNVGLRVRGRDRLGNVGPWSSARVTAVYTGELTIRDSAPELQFWGNEEKLLTLGRTLIPPSPGVDVLIDGERYTTLSDNDLLTSMPLWQKQVDGQDLAINAERDLIAVSWSYSGTASHAQFCRATDGYYLGDIDASNNTSYSGFFPLQVAFDPHADSLYTAFYGTGQKLWDIGTRQLIRTFPDIPANTNLSEIAIDHAGYRLVSAGGGMLRMWNTTTTTLERSISSSGTVKAAAFSDDDARLALSYYDNARLRIYNLADGSLIREIPAIQHGGGVAFVPGRGWVVAMQNATTAAAWDSQTGQLMASYAGLPAIAGDFDASPNGEFIASSAGGDTIRIWNVETGNVISTLKGQRNSAMGRFLSDWTFVSASPLGCYDLRPTYRVNLIGVPEGEHQLTLAGSGVTPLQQTIFIKHTPPSVPGTPQAAAHLPSPVRFDWSASTETLPVTGQITYECELRSFWDPARRQQTQETNIATTGTVNEKIRCRVRAKDAAGNFSAWSDWSTTVTVAATRPPTCAGITLYSKGAAVPNLATTTSVELAVRDARQGPIWLDVAEDANFTSVTTLSFDELRPHQLGTWTNSVYYYYGDVVFDPAGRFLAQSDGATFELHPTLQQNWPTSTDWSEVLAFSADGRYFLGYGYHDRFPFPNHFKPHWYYVVDLDTMQTKKSWYFDARLSACFRPGTSQVAFVSSDLVTFLSYDAQATEPIPDPIPKTNFGWISFDAKGERLLLSAQTPTWGQVWDLRTRTAQTFTDTEYDGVYSLGFYGDGSRLYTVSYRRSYPNEEWKPRLWDVATGQPISSLTPPWLSALDGTRALQVKWNQWDSPTYWLADVDTGEWVQHVDGWSYSYSSVDLNAQSNLLVTVETPNYGTTRTTNLHDLRHFAPYQLTERKSGSYQLYVRLRNLAGASPVYPICFGYDDDAAHDGRDQMLAYLAGAASSWSVQDVNGDQKKDIADLIFAARPRLGIDLGGVKEAVSGGELTVGWSRKPEVGTALRVELWRGNQSCAALGDIHSEEPSGATKFTIPALAPAGDYEVRLYSYWLENTQDPQPWVAWSMPLRITVAAAQAVHAVTTSP